MAHVIACSDCLAFTGGVAQFDVSADNVRRLILEIDARYPGLGDFVDRKMAIAIDGEIHRNAYSARLAPDSEVYLIPKIGGG